MHNGHERIGWGTFMKKYMWCHADEKTFNGSISSLTGYVWQHWQKLCIRMLIRHQWFCGMAQLLWSSASHYLKSTMAFLMNEQWFLKFQLNWPSTYAWSILISGHSFMTSTGVSSMQTFTKKIRAHWLSSLQINWHFFVPEFCLWTNKKWIFSI